jgi:hypothetical protein
MGRRPPLAGGRVVGETATTWSSCGGPPQPKASDLPRAPVMHSDEGSCRRSRGRAGRGPTLALFGENDVYMADRGISLEVTENAQSLDHVPN